MDRAFSSCVRCLATDADSDVVWAGDEAGRLAVLRCAVSGLPARDALSVSTVQQAQAAPEARGQHKMCACLCLTLLLGLQLNHCLSACKAAWV